jgi:hypothetical protein
MNLLIEIRIAEALRELTEMPNLSFRAAQKKHGIPGLILACCLRDNILKKTAR